MSKLQALRVPLSVRLASGARYTDSSAGPAVSATLSPHWNGAYRRRCDRSCAWLCGGAWLYGGAWLCGGGRVWFCGGAWLYAGHECSPRGVGNSSTGSCNGGGDGTRLDINAAEVVVLVAVRVTVTWKLENTKMPVRAVGGSGSRDGSDGEGKWVGASGVPESDGVGGEVL